MSKLKISATEMVSQARARIEEIETRVIEKLLECVEHLIARARVPIAVVDDVVVGFGGAIASPARKPASTSRSVADSADA